MSWKSFFWFTGTVLGWISNFHTPQTARLWSRHCHVLVLGWWLHLVPLPVLCFQKQGPHFVKSEMTFHTRVISITRLSKTSACLLHFGAHVWLGRPDWICEHCRVVANFISFCFWSHRIEWLFDHVRHKCLSSFAEN